MASEWHYRLGDRELGPIAYRELVQLVREGTVRKEDLVRGEWPSDWQRADSVVGLFHMARRQEAEVRTEVVATAQTTKPEDVSAVVQPSPSRRMWLVWFLPALFRRRSADPPTFTSAPAPAISSSLDSVVVPLDRQVVPEPAPLAPTRESASIAHPGSGSPAKANNREEAIAEETILPSDPEMEPIMAASGSREWAGTVAEALGAAEARDAALSRQRAREELRGRVRGSVGSVLGWMVRIVFRPVVFLFGWLTSAGGSGTRDRVAAGLSVLERWLPRPSILRIGFKLSAAVVVANLAAFGILKWSDRQALRFPGTESEAGRAFPIIGECGPTEFGFLVFQVALFAGVAAYGVAAILEANADD